MKLFFLRINIVGVILFCSCGILFTQNNDLDVLRQVQAYHNSDEIIHYQMTTEVFKNEENGLVPESASMTYMKKGDNVFYKHKDYKVILNDNYMIRVNEERKFIICNKISKEDTRNVMNGVDVDTLLSLYEQITLVPETKKYRHYHLVNDDALYHVVDLYIDQNVPKIQKIDCYFNPEIEEEVHHITYTLKYLPVAAVKSGSVFSEKKYLNIKNNEVALTGKYKNYKLILGNDLAYSSK